LALGRGGRLPHLINRIAQAWTCATETSMQSKLLSRRDIDFLLYEWLNVESLTSRARYADHSR
jgi:hypothetical protein